MTGKCICRGRSERAQPRIDCAACGGRACAAHSCWELCPVHVCPEDTASPEEEACFQEEDEKGEAQARCFRSGRIRGLALPPLDKKKGVIC
ncbi:hypothetical protein QJS04_geneDACA010556 [Acorus gramineus]|uniref:DUF2180 family protein n=1 Tax=Acorus gramineus TaxID=55184 RepID=A0AAV9ALR2_ACOGR|nr:hypothetical protein QJS04_geneDACA010556 [Acorus gramineus]